MHTKLIQQLHSRLCRHASETRKHWWENYVKGSAPFLGVKMGDIRTVVSKWHQQQVAHQLHPDEQLELALALFEGEFTEHKLAGILLIGEILRPRQAVKCPQDIPKLGCVFDRKWIYDWNVCDWFCVKILGPMIKTEGITCAREIAAWREAPYLWKARAALVPFVSVAADSRYYPLVAETAHILIGRPERFAKTAVGWVLREISRHHPDWVRMFVEAHIEHFSAESLRNATRHFAPENKQRMQEWWKSTRDA